MAEERVWGGVAGAIGGEERVHARQEPRLLATRVAPQGEGQGIANVRDRHSGRARERQALGRVEAGTGIGKPEPQVAGVDDLQVTRRQVQRQAVGARCAGRRTSVQGGRNRAAIGGQNHDVARAALRRGKGHRDHLVPRIGGELPRHRVAGRVQAQLNKIPRAGEGAIHGRLARPEGLRRAGDDVADREAAAAGNEQDGEGRAADADGDSSGQRRAMSPHCCSEASLASGHRSRFPLCQGDARLYRVLILRQGKKLTCQPQGYRPSGRAR